MGSNELKESTLERVNGAFYNKRATVMKNIRESETRREIIDKHFQVQVLENQLEIDQKVQELGRRCMEEDQQRVYEAK